MQHEAALRPVERQQLRARARLAGRGELSRLVSGFVYSAPVRAPTAAAAIQSTIAAMIQPSQRSYPPYERASQIPSMRVPSAPIPTETFPTRDRLHAEHLIGRVDAPPGAMSTQKSTSPPTYAKALST